ncbi:YlmC/YmxH family sporulation protein [Gracilibacillus caseinilyticus]|uniref:YlmC/YmxH family sporulation protein n=1 Tax=Gracilibacillus caseinilyticus TaxID=2932256 RepID=A0ABY4EU52_9BACI|nr:YlmC/YmxH family sporulation protein [Gracilibacillus caseinilyticus]UOQ47949.1 YlmC/YmxH family sporulation protein [Gracilibacillus caseinilyticus]
MITLSSLQLKDIVYIEDGTKLGNLTDIEINIDLGSISNLVVATKTKMFGVFGESREVIIPWEHVMKIGHDVILVKKNGSFSAITTSPKDDDSSAYSQ